MNDLINRGNNVVSIADHFKSLRTSLAKLQQELPARVTDPYLRLGRDGIWIYGAENTEVEPGSKWQMDLDSFQHGYVCWSRYDENDKRGNEKLGEVMVPHWVTKPDKATLSDHGFPWSEQVSVKLACISGEDAGTQVLYSATSVGGLGEIKEKLLPVIFRAMDDIAQQGEVTENLIPVVQLANSSYNHSKYGKIYTPAFKFLGFVTPGGKGSRERQPEVVQGKPMDEPEAPRRRRPRV